MDRKEGNIFYRVGNNEGQKGVGSLIKRSAKNTCVNSEVWAMQRWNSGTWYELVIILVYAPTAASNNKVSEEFYRVLNKTLKGVKGNTKTKKKVLMGYSNSQIGQGKEKEKSVIGECCCGSRNGSRNKRSERLNWILYGTLICKNVL